MKRFTSWIIIATIFLFSCFVFAMAIASKYDGNEGEYFCELLASCIGGALTIASVFIEINNEKTIRLNENKPNFYFTERKPSQRIYIFTAEQLKRANRNQTYSPLATFQNTDVKSFAINKIILTVVNEKTDYFPILDKFIDKDEIFEVFLPTNNDDKPSKITFCVEYFYLNQKNETTISFKYNDGTLTYERE